VDGAAGLAARIRAEFPALAFDQAALSDEGDDHRIVILDDAWVFRFPRRREGEDRPALFRAELSLLARLAEISPIPVPRYEFISAGGGFGGYRKIAGEPMRPALFAALAPQARTSILDEVAGFLRLLHATPPTAIARAGGEIAREWTGAAFHDRWIAERRAAVAGLVDAPLLERMDRFYDLLANAGRPPREVLTHGDLSDDHMLVSPGRDGLAGIIDFSDACLGDPAYDLTFFLSYGEAAARRLADRYDPMGEDPTLLTRARLSHARFRIEQLRQARAFPHETAQLLADLPGLLDQVLERNP
jgi:aminoglycoside 2''-phosphotransferase